MSWSAILGSGANLWSRPPRCCESGARPVSLVKPGGDTAHDYRAETAIRRTIRSGDVSVSRHLQNAELLGQETAIPLSDGFIGPLIDVGVPDWAVIRRSRGNSAKRVIWPMTIQK